MTTYIPEKRNPSSKTTDENKQQLSSKRQNIKKTQHDASGGRQDELGFSSGIGFDSKEVSENMLTEEIFLIAVPITSVIYRDDIPRGMGCVIVWDRLTRKSYNIPFLLKKDLEFVKRTMELYYLNGCDITLILNNADDEVKLIIPKLDARGRDIASLN